MKSNFETFLKMDLNSYSTPEYLSVVEKGLSDDSIKRMSEMGKLITKAVTIANTSEIPQRLIELLEDMISTFLEMKNGLDDLKVQKRDINPNNVFNRIRAEYTNFFEPSSSNKALMTINAISNYESFFDRMSINKLNDLNNELEGKNKRVDAILRKLENPSAEKLLSDYASEYATEESKNNKASTGWLVTGIITTMLFIWLVLCSINNDWFPSKLELKDESNNTRSTHEIINVPVLVTKVMLVSLIIYFILFCFKQYSIYKHLTVVNQQKKNAFNSYNLFAASFGEKDTEAKKAVLMSLAKTIHESINTGFLSSKQPDQPLIQNLDLGKLSS